VNHGLNLAELPAQIIISTNVSFPELAACYYYNTIYPSNN